LQIEDSRIADWRLTDCRLAIDGLPTGDRRIADWRLDQRRTNCDLWRNVPAHCRETGLNSLALPMHGRLTMHQKALELQERTRRFATAVIKFCDRLPQHRAASQIAEQLLDSSGSTDSNYRATCRARSLDEFIAKIGVAAEEADESEGWLQLLVASDLATIDDARELIQEAHELTAIFVASRKTAQCRKADRERLQKQLRESTRRRSK
jgi:four helix bundle protein